MHFAQLLFPDFALIFCGLVLCRFTAINRNVWDQIEILVYYFLFPLLLFRSILQAPLDLQASASFIGAGLVLGLLCISLAYALPYLPWLGKKLEPRDYAASAQIAFRFNSFIILSIAERLAGAQGVMLVSLLVGFCVPLFNAASVWPMARHSQRGYLRELLRNPLIIATTSGLLLNLLGFSLPSWLDPSVARIGQASIVLGLMTAGAGMQFRALAAAKALGAAVLTIRHFIAPVLAWALASAFGLNAVQTLILLVFSASPTASTSYVLAARMGYNGGLVACLVSLSTLLGMVSLPFALMLR